MIITLIEMLHMARIFPWETFSNTSQKEIRFLFDQECFWSVCSHNVCSLSFISCLSNHVDKLPLPKYFFNIPYYYHSHVVSLKDSHNYLHT